MTYACGTCEREFPTGFHARDQHLAATGHVQPRYECNVCDPFFGSDKAVEQHMDSRNHWGGPDYDCDMCNDSFWDEEQLRNHEVEKHLYCDACDRNFMNYNIEAHLNSKLHRPQTLSYSFCGISRANATGLIHHWERGSCPNAPLDRAQLYEAVRRRDPNDHLVKKLLASSSSIDTRYEASHKAFNYESGCI